jgi:hypothetical protein
MKSRLTALVVSAVAALTGCAPRAAYVGPVGDFAAAQASLSGAVKSDVDSATTTDRIAHVRRQIFTIAEQSASPRPNIAVRSSAMFLCEAVAKREAIAFDQSYIATTAANMSAIAKPPPEKFEDLVKQLGERYQIRVEEKFNSRETRDKCVELYNSPDKWRAKYPRSGPGMESPAAIIGAAEAVYTLVAKLGQIVLTEVDDARRARAFAEYFGNKENTDKLRAYIERLRLVLKARLDIDRAKAHQNYEAAFAPLQKHLYESSAANEPGCNAWQGAANKPVPQDYATDARFRACFDALWKKTEPTLEKALVAAAAYDPLMLARENEAFATLEKSIDKMEKLANGKLDDLEELKLIIQAVVKIFKAVEEVKKTVDSDDTKATVKKIKDLLAQLG